MTTTDLTVDAAGLTHTGVPVPDRVFLVLSGEPDAPSRVVTVDDGAEVTFGRSRGATIAIDTEKVSRLHARVRRDGDRLVIEDLESRNGTRVNGERITAPTELRPGDEIAIGPVSAVVGRNSRLRRSVPVAEPTGLEDRLAAELDRAVRYRRVVAVAMLRIAGDVDAAIERLAALVRPMDLVADMGGDELAVLLPELDRAEAARAVDRLADEVRAAGATLSYGLALGPEDGTHVDQVIGVARAAMRAARAPRPAVAPAVAPVAPDVVVADPAMQKLYGVIDRIADTPMTILIIGETGVGKEVIAEAVHKRSSRRAGPLVKLNCASLPETLLESELFGHEKGSFTGAERRKIGFFEAAVGGTLLLDEIGEMPPSLQAKLLRVLERKVVTRVGGTAEIPVDVRVLAATNRDLEGEVRAGRFREDLYFRVAAFTLVVPPLRDRKAEIPILAERFAARFAIEMGVAPPQITAGAHAALASHDWPGNVRELKNAIDRALVLAGDGPITAAELPERVIDAGRRAAVVPTGGGGVREQLADVERAAIAAALDEHGGNQTRAARHLGLSRRALIYKMERYGLKPPPPSADQRRPKGGGS